MCFGVSRTPRMTTRVESSKYARARAFERFHDFDPRFCSPRTAHPKHLSTHMKGLFDQTCPRHGVCGQTTPPAAALPIPTHIQTQSCLGLNPVTRQRIFNAHKPKPQTRLQSEPSVRASGTTQCTSRPRARHTAWQLKLHKKHPPCPHNSTLCA